MPTSKFVLRGTNPEKPTPIVLLFRYGNQVLKFSTGFKVTAEQWNEKKQTVRNVLSVSSPETINKGLENTRERIENAYNELIEEGYNGSINNTLLRSKLEEKSAKKGAVSPYVTDYLMEFIKTAPTRIVLKQNGKTDVLRKSTIKQYSNTLRVLEEYQQFLQTKLRFVNLDLKFHKDFIGYLSNEKRLAQSTIGTRVKTLKTLAKYAKIDGVKMNEQIFTREFFKPNEPSIDTYLNEKEVQQIFDFDLTNNPKLDRVRDLFIIGLWTGLRVSDFTKIKKENLKEGFIEIENLQKTDVPIILPIHHQVEQIISKYKGGLPRSISHQKFNEYVKELCKLVGITERIKGAKKVKTKFGIRKVNGTYPKYELISSHICRRSFATNNYGKFSNATIMAITGHKSESVFLKYIKITPKEHAENMRQQWIQERKEQGQNPTLKKVV